MKTDPAVIDGLSEVLTAELTAISQYFVHHAMVESYGYDVLAKGMRAESIDEMRHAETLTERILYYDGTPNLQKLGKLNIGRTIPEMLKADYDLEVEAVERLNRLIGEFQALGDHGAAQVLRGILADEEHHIGWLETQMELIKSIGLENYLSRQFSPSVQ